jgi:hypothetical protein
MPRPFFEILSTFINLKQVKKGQPISGQDNDKLKIFSNKESREL